MSSPQSTGTFRTSGRVVLGYSNDAAGLSALHIAVDEARIRRALLTVIHRLVGTERPAAFGVDADPRSASQATKRDIFTQINELAPGYDQIEVVVVSTPVVQELVSASRTAALVVLGVSTPHALSAVALDSVPRAVVRRARCPVMLVPAGTHAIFPRMLVCGTDRSPESAEALCWAADEAGLRGVTLMAIDARRQRPDGSTLSEWVQRQHPMAATTILCSEEPDRRPARRLVDEAETRAAILVVGRHVTRDHRRSVSAQVSAQTRVPTVVVPAHHGAQLKLPTAIEEGPQCRSTSQPSPTPRSVPTSRTRLALHLVTSPPKSE